MNSTESNASNMSWSNQTTTTASSPVASQAFTWRNFEDLMFLYFHPGISIFGFVCNLICLAVFLTPRFRKNNMYVMMGAASFFYAAALGIMMGLPSIRTEVRWSYSVAVYRLYFRPWLHNTFSMCALCCNIAVSWDRYVLIGRRFKCSCTQIPPILLMIIFFIVSAILFGFVLFAYTVSPHPLGFSLLYTDFGNSAEVFIVRVIAFGTRDILLWIVFVFINTLLVIETKRHMSKKKALAGAKSEATSTNTDNAGKTEAAASKSASEKAERRVTNMVLVNSLILVLGRTPHAVQIMFYFLSGPELIAVRSYFNSISTLIILASYSLNLFIFWMYDKNFKGFIKEVLGKLKC
nr:G protein-coupled receptor [Proales similis]